MTKKLLALILAAILAMSMIACNPDADEPEASSSESVSESPSESESIPETDPPATDAALLKDGKTAFALVRETNASADVKDALSLLYTNLISKYPTAGFSIKEDLLLSGQAPGEYELLVGCTNREGSEEFRAGIPADCFKIEVSEFAIRIDGTDDSQVVRGLMYFLTNYLEEDANGNIILPFEAYVSEPYKASVKDKINSTDKLTTISEHHFDVPEYQGHRTMQGSCSDGTYLYACMINGGADTEVCYVLKYEIATGKLVAVSEALSTDHSNDATYVPLTNEIYISHNSPKFSRVSVLDADTLEYKETIITKYSIYGIAYEPTRDVFLLGLSFGYDFAVVNREDFTPYAELMGESDRFTGVKTGNTKQGVECDDTYLYFVQYAENVLVVYNWNGEYVTTVELDVKVGEPESMSIIGDTMYIAYNSTGGRHGIIYKSKIKVAG